MKIMEVTKRGDLLLLRETASQVFADGGYRVESPGSVKGESGVTHQVDLYCSKEGKRVLVDIRRDTDSVGVLPVLSLFMKTFDSKPSKPILLAASKVSTIAKQLCHLYNVEIGEVESPNQVKGYLNRILGLGFQLSRFTTYDTWRLEMMQSKRIRERVIKSALDILVLLSTRDVDLTGYDIIRTVHSKFNILLSPGTVYPLLKRLEREGMISVKEQEGKKVYSKTQLGTLASDILYTEYGKIQEELLTHLGTLKRE